MKQCNLCGETQSLDEFPDTMSKGKLRKRSYCRQCNRINALKTYHKRMQDPAYAAERKIRDKKRKLKSYDLSIEDFESYGEYIQWRCEICGISIMNNPYVDHNHETNTVRGFLCFHCNVGIGHFGDSISRLLNAIDYLTE